MKPIAASVLLVCVSLSPALRAADKVTYNDHVQPIFRNSCLNCHNPDKKKAGLDLSTYQAALAGSDNGKVLESGNPGNSQLIKCIKQIDDPKMPPKGDKLSDSDIGTIEKWIAGQLLETATGKAVATSNNVAVAVVSLDRPAGPPPMPGDLPLEPVVRTKTTNAVVALAASPWAPLVAVGGQRQVVLYNTETLQPLGILPFNEGLPAIIRFSRNGQLLLIGGGLGGKSGRVTLWNVQTGERAGVVGNEFDEVLAADLSPDQAHVALGGPLKLLKIYSTKDGKLEYSLKKHTDWITAISFSADGKYLASADRSGAIVVWEGTTGKEYNTLPGHKVAVTSLAFMPGVLASGSEDGTVVLWDIQEAKEIRKWNAHPGGVEWVEFTTDGRVVSCGRDHIARVWDQTGKKLFESKAFEDIALRAVLTENRVIAGDWTGDVKVFAISDKPDGKPIGELSPNPPSINEQLASAEKNLADARAALPALQQAYDEAQKKGPAPAVDAPKPPDEAPKAQAAAGHNAAAVAERQKKLDDLTAEIGRRREARAKLQDGTPEYAEANAKVQEIKPAIADAQAKLDAAKAAADAAPAPAPAPPAPVNERAKAKAALDQKNTEIAAAQAEVERWKRAGAFMSVHKAKETLADAENRFAQLSEAAKDALAPADAVQNDLSATEKAVADAPKQLAQLQNALAEAHKSGDPLAGKTTAAEEALKQKETESKSAADALVKANAEATDLPKKLEQQNAEVAKLREERGKQQDGTPEYATANDKVQAKKAEIAQTESAVEASKSKAAEAKTKAETALAEVAKARDAIEPARAAAKAAADKIADAEKALAKANKETADATAKLADLRKKAPEIVANAKTAKSKAEQDAAAAAKELETAKAEATRARADFDAHFPPAKPAEEQKVAAK
ncbi:MAG TPA: c-type cytochrome domain-containing protein [Chthoniobacteraceae bacterium]